MPDELCFLGDFAWDVLIRTDSELLTGGDTFGDVSLMPGGSAANTAVWAARCGANSHFIGKVGGDRFGQLARENLSAERVTAHLAEDPVRPTGSVAVFVDHTGQRSMVSGRGADFELQASDLPGDVLKRVAHLHLTGWSFFSDPPRSAAVEAARVAKESGATVSMDPSAFQMIDELGASAFLEITQPLGLDVFLPNKDEGYALTNEREPLEMARTLAELYPGSLIVLKLDADGALLHLDGDAHHVEPAVAKLVDSTGAGDSFAGSFLAHYINGGDAVAATRFAATIAAWTIGQTGARPDGDSRLSELLRPVL